MKTNIELTATERLILALLLEDAPSIRFETLNGENGKPVTDDYLSNLWDKLQPL